MIPALIFGNGWESIPPAMEKEIGGTHVPPGVVDPLEGPRTGRWRASRARRWGSESSPRCRVIFRDRALEPARLKPRSD